ncbi:hypothetical protein AB6806_03000 [Bosea sp. RCC_152_1]|uniref:hypothetical protein n=1 Tax=Bosea sp. RCC_152_1 TaxID=3239228 RepID=UPI0035251AB1
MMFEPLPPETIALQFLLADLHDDLSGRVARLRLLLAFEADFGQGRGLLLPGGTPAQFAYTETRQAFIQGNFLSVILLSQCVLENVLTAEIGLLSLSNEIKGVSTIRLKDRPWFRDIVVAGRSAGILGEEDERDLLRLAELRNALTHFRTVDDASHIDQRALSERRAAIEICEEDARFAILLFVRILAKPQFRFRMDPVR